MFEPEQYELIDFGGGRKLERFGSELLDRPSPAAARLTVADAGAWGSASIRFDVAPGGKGEWNITAEPWPITHGTNQLVLQLSGSGNIGVFPEQADNWDWIADQVRRCESPRVLNLFAYTGGATLAAAAAGAEVTHVDSSGPTVAWAKRNAEASGMADLPIRWLVDDALKFVAREVRRGNHYDGVIADPPTYGHGPKGKPFKFNQHLDLLLEGCAELLRETGRFLVFSCHTPGFDARDAEAAVSAVLPGRVTSQTLALAAADGRELFAGVSARWSG